MNFFSKNIFLENYEQLNIWPDSVIVELRLRSSGFPSLFSKQNQNLYHVQSYFFKVTVSIILRLLGTFPKLRLFPTQQLSKCIFPDRQLSKCAISKVATFQVSPNRSSQQLAFYVSSAQPFADVSTSEGITKPFGSYRLGNWSLGSRYLKMSLGKYLTPF